VDHRHFGYNANSPQKIFLERDDALARTRERDRQTHRQEEVVRARAGEREREGERCERLCRFVCCNGKKYGDFRGDFGDGKL
jgi:hypothetical protein